MVAAFHAVSFLRVKPMHRGPPASGARPKEVRVAVVELPLDGQIGCPLHLGANIDLLPSMYLLDHLLPAVGISPGGELRDDAVAHRLILLPVDGAQGLPPLKID